MAILRPGPYTLQFPMQHLELTHAIEVNCDVLGTPTIGTVPGDVNMVASSAGVDVTLDDAANDMWDAFRQMYNAATLCSTYTLWKRTETTTERIFISGGVLTSPNGVSAAANTLAGQGTFTFRSGAGGIGKLVFLEGTFGTSPTGRLPWASSTDPAAIAIRNYILSDENIISARDRGFPVTPMNATFGQNEKVFNRRFRS